MFKRILTGIEKWLHEVNRNAQYNAWISRIMDTHPEVNDWMKEYSGLADPDKSEPIDKNALFIGHNLYIGIMWTFQPSIIKYRIWTAEDPKVHIHKATLLYDNKVLLHGEWENLIMGLLTSAYDNGLFLKSEIDRQERETNQARLDYFSSI